MVEISAEQAVGMVRANEARLGQIRQQMAEATRTMEVIGATRSTLEQLPDEEAVGLMPAGGVYMPIKANASTVKVEVGVGVVVEKTREEAIATLKQREENIRMALAQLQEAGAKIAAESMEIRKKLSERAPQPDVPVISG